MCDDSLSCRRRSLQRKAAFALGLVLIRIAEDPWIGMI
jgi:hypothetical protein